MPTTGYASVVECQWKLEAWLYNGENTGCEIVAASPLSGRCENFMQ